MLSTRSSSETSSSVNELFNAGTISSVQNSKNRTGKNWLRVSKKKNIITKGGIVSKRREAKPLRLTESTFKKKNKM